MLIDQFIDALSEWSRRTGDPDDAWAGTIMVWTGGAWRFDPVGAIDPTTVPKERRAKLTAGEVHGTLTLDQLRADLEQLVNVAHMDEQFLIVSLVNHLEREMEVLSEEYAKGLRNRRREAERLEALLNDPAKIEDYLHRMNERREPGQEPFTSAGLISLAQKLRSWAVPSLQEQRERRAGLDAWREVTAPILEPQNLRRARKAFAEQRGYGWLYGDNDDA